jgi:iron complex outermembrane receptor protein
LLAYLSYAEGFKSGGINYLLLSRTDLSLYNPEKSSTWELGSKLQFLDRRLRVNAAVFHTLYKDIQFEHFFFNPAVCGTGTFFCSRTLNAAEARIQGVELEMTAAAARGLELFANVAYMQNKVTKVDAALIALRALDPTVLNLGTTLPRAPDWTVTIGGSYAFAVGELGGLTLRADYGYKTLVYFDSADVRGAAQGGYGIVNAGISFETIAGRWEFALNGQNLADKLYATNGTGTTFPSDGYAIVSYGPPRTVTGSFRYRFGVH